MSKKNRAQLAWMARAMVALWLAATAGNAEAGANDAAIQVAPGGTAMQLTNGATSVLANATVSGDPQLLSVVSWSPVAHGTLDMNSDGTFRYVNDGLGAATDSFSYQACQGPTSCSMATVSIQMASGLGNVLEFSAYNDGIQVASGGTASRMISGKASLAGDAGWAEGKQFCTASLCTFNLLGGPSHGSLSFHPNGTFTYANDGLGAPTDYFRYQACWNSGPCAVATIGIVVLAGGVITDDVPLSLSSGYFSTCALMYRQDARCWGPNYGGVLGAGLYGSYPSQAVPILDRTSNPLQGIQAIALGNYHACAVMANGTVLCWGSNDYGQLGTGQVDKMIHPAGYVRGLGPGDTARATAIAAGQEHTCVVLTTGMVECWGDNAHDEIGQVNPGAPNLEAFPQPTPVNLGAAVATSITAGEDHTCATTSLGTMCWGLNTLGELGRSTAPAFWDMPGTSILQLAGMTRLESGTSADHDCALSGSGALWCWGRYESGELGDGTSSYGFKPMGRYNPSKVLGGLNVSSYALGALDTCAIVYGGVWCWGDNSFGQLANQNLQFSATPVATPIVSGASAIAVGAGYACALVNRLAACWGVNDSSALGIGTDANAIPATATPTPVVGFPSLPAAPTAKVAFSPATVNISGANPSTSMTITLTNPDAAPITGVAFHDAYPAGMANSSDVVVQGNSCGGTVAATAGGSFAQLANGTIPASGSCSIVVNLVPTQTGTWVNYTGGVTSINAQTSVGASASLTVIAIVRKGPGQTCPPGSTTCS